MSSTGRATTTNGAAQLDRPLRGRGDLASRRSGGESIEVFTTRPDTIFGATYLVLAPEHPLLQSITTAAQRAEVDAYREHSTKQDLVARKTNKEKTGVFTGAYALNPATGGPIPVWIADYVLMEYGTGAIMAVPGHDERDFEFAPAFKLPIVRVIAARGRAMRARRSTEPYDGRGARGELGGIRRAVERGGDGEDHRRGSRSGARRARVTNYRLHDWCISRQRYWGPPIPIIYCDDVRHAGRCRRRTCRWCCRTSTTSARTTRG